MKTFYLQVLKLFVPSFFFLAFSALLFSCKSTEKTKKPIVLFDRSPGFIFEKINENELKFDWLSTKITVDFDMEDKTNSFKANVKLKKDSIIWISIIPALGIEAARAKITPDSVFFINRLNATYFKGDYKFLSKFFQAEVDYKLLQALLTATKYTEVEEEEYKSFIDDGAYLLSTIRKRKLKKTWQRNDSLNLEVQSIWVDPATFKIKRYRFNDFLNHRELNIRYSEFSPIAEQLFPLNLEIELKGETSIKIKMSYTKIAQEAPSSLPFNIPDKYEQIF